LRTAEVSAALLRPLVGATGPVRPSAAQWPSWLWWARIERVAPLLFHLVDAEETDLADEQRAELRQLQGAVMSRCVQLEHHAIAVSASLTEEGIAVVLLKGGATSHLDYPDPTWREFGDIDLLVHERDRVRSIRILEQLGWRQGYALPRGHGEFTHAVTFTKDGMELDLHQRIAHRALGLLLPVNELFDRAITVTIAGVELLAFDHVDRLLHAAVHALTSRGASAHLSSSADVLLLANQRSGAVSAALERAERARIRPLVERAVLDAHREAMLAPPPEWTAARAVPASGRDRLVERAYLGRNRRVVAEELAYLRLLDGWSRRWSYLRGHFDRDYAEEAGRSGVWAQIGYLASKFRRASE
jgi:hypothetical protein